MILWLDAQLSPTMARWLADRFALEVHAVRDLGLLRATDGDIFAQARQAGAVVLTKDRDFVRLLEQHGPPPQILWLTCGNTRNAALPQILVTALPAALRMLDDGANLIELDG